MYDPRDFEGIKGCSSIVKEGRESTEQLQVRVGFGARRIIVNSVLFTVSTPEWSRVSMGEEVSEPLCLRFVLTIGIAP